MPSREFSKERIVRSIERVLSNRDISFLTQEAYTFIHLLCGSIAHFSLEGWRHTYRDLRDFLNFFLVKNEYGTCLVDPPPFMNLTDENRQIILAVVSVCQKYREEIANEIDEREAELGKEIGKKLSSGELSLQELFRRRSDIEDLIYSNHATETVNSKCVDPIGGIAEIAPA
jgi:hypothetical protein